MTKSPKPEVKVGQVWREKDKRFSRYVRLVAFITAPMVEAVPGGLLIGFCSQFFWLPKD